MYYTYFHRVPSLYIQNDDFLKLPGDLQKVCKNTGVLAHRVPDAYVFIGKIMGGTPRMVPHDRLNTINARVRKAMAEYPAALELLPRFS